jgi:DNA repair protein RadC
MTNPLNPLEVSRAKPRNLALSPKEYKVIALRECPGPEGQQTISTPEEVADYWRAHVTAHPAYNPDVECLVALMANTRRRAIGHVLISSGTLDTLLVHPREVFRAAIIAAASAVVLAHNHPSGDPTPSEADIKVTRDLIRAGNLLKVELLDHVIIGHPSACGGKGFCSLRSLGYFF